MDTLILEDYRCFRNRHEVPLRPLTLLVGENSTGKTSFLAAVRAAHDLQRISEELSTIVTPDFNEKPFHLGSYEQIANHRSVGSDLSTSFMIGQVSTVSPEQRWFVQKMIGVDVQGTDTEMASQEIIKKEMASLKSFEMQIEARFSSEDKQPLITEFSAAQENHRLIFKNAADGEKNLLQFYKNGAVVIEHEEEKNTPPLLLGRKLLENSTDNKVDDRIRMAEIVYLARLGLGSGNRPYAFSPIRTSPQRTYERVREIRDSEGTHIPQTLARLLGTGGSSEFKRSIKEFGADSSLYSDLIIRRLGKKGGDPFQIMIRQPQGGSRQNLVDVGYGVSQAIPIIVDAISMDARTMLLIQQPEVHLHPRAQAAMGSFFAQLAASGRNRLVVETHSDYLVDRVRMDVRDERIKASDVVILYFEQSKVGVDIHPITIDEMGNLEGTPDSYGGFFLDEQRRFFMVD